MFNLFKRKRTKPFPWELEMLVAVFGKMPPAYHRFRDQIEEGLLSKVHIHSDAPDQVGFSYNPELSGRYEVRKEPFFRLSGIKIKNRANGQFHEMEIMATCGLFMNYSLAGHETFEPNLESIDVSGMRRENFNGGEYKEIENLLTKTEKDLIHKTEVYAVTLNDKVYYHLIDTADGDFIGIDLNKNVFEITHDPFEIRPMLRSLTEVLQERMKS